MKRWAAVLLVLLAALPAAAKDEKKGAPPGVVSAADLAKEAAAKEAAGDLDGAAELLKKAGALPDATGEMALQLGRVLEAKNDVDLALDAYQTAAAKLSGAAKGEAL